MDIKPDEFLEEIEIVSEETEAPKEDILAEDNPEIEAEATEPAENTSSAQPKKEETVLKKASNIAISKLDIVIKIISFIVAIGILFAFFLISSILIKLDEIFTVVAIGVAVLGVVLALISLFVIYAIGQIISQNNEILKKL